MDKKIINYIPFKNQINAIRQCYVNLIILNEANKDYALYYLNNASNAKRFLSRKKLFEYILNEYVKKSNYKNKLFLEFGTWKGESINILSKIMPDVTFYGFDSFEGLPNTEGVWEKKRFNENGKMPKVNKNVKLIKGYFDVTLPDFVKNHNEKIAFLHIDSDIYSSAKTIFDNLYHLIEPGTIIEFDEYYYYIGWREHEYKAFQEFCKKYNVKYEYIATFLHRMSVKIISIDN